MWSNSVPAVLGRWALFAGLLLVVGAWAFRLLVARDPLQGPQAAPVSRALGRAAGVGGVLLVLGVLARLGIQVLDFLEPSEPAWPQIQFLVTEIRWGRIWMLQFALSVVVAATLPVLVGKGTVPLALMGAVLLALVATPALSGHAAGAQEWTTLAIAMDTAHVAAGGLWLGTLTVVLWAAFSLPAGEGGRNTAVRSWMTPFHRLALVSVGVILVSGVFATWLHAESPATLLGTSWGLALLAKVGAVVLVLAVGWRNGWRLRPRLQEPDVPHRLLGGAVWEVVLTQLVLLATAVLVALSPS